MAADSASVLAWREELGALQVRLGALFVRAEPRRQAGLYLEGLLSAAKRKNGWQLAEHLGDARPWRTQRVLSHVLWDEAAARDLCREHAVGRLGAEDAERRRAAKVPEDVPFLTKPAIAREIIARALDAGAPCDWVLGDEVYGADRQL